VAKGDRVGMWSPNHLEWVITQYATAKIGAILVNINPAYRTTELRYALGQSGVSVLVAARGFRETDYVAMIDEVRPQLPGLRAVVLLGDGPHPGAMTWADLLARAADTPEEALRERAATLDFDDPINIQYTSGTTGAPKGATLSHHNILNNGYFVGGRLRLTDRDRVCLSVPFYHCFGMVMGNLGFLTHGGTVVLPAETFDAGACLEAIQREACTTLYGVPTMFIAILGHPDFERYELTSLRTGIMAGSPCPVEVMRRTIDRMHMDEVTICYGMTETSPVSFQSFVDDDVETRVSTVGAIQDWVECKVVDPATGRTVPRGERGELCTRGYPVMLGYWDNEDPPRRGPGLHRVRRRPRPRPRAGVPGSGARGAVRRRPRARQQGARVRARARVQPVELEGLRDQLLRGLRRTPVQPGTVDGYGARFTADILVRGPNGATATVRTGWILRPGSKVPELTTLFIP